MKQFLLTMAVLLTVFTTNTAQTTIFSDDFESGDGNFTLEGAWGLTNAQSNSPSNSLTDSPGGDYAANQNITATLATALDLSTALDAELRFATIYDIENGNFDYAFTEVSTDGGNTWTEVGRIFGEDNLDTWQNITYSLAGFAGESSVLFRFRFFSDQGYEVDGIYIDDVEVVISDVDNGAPLITHEAPELYEGAEGDFIRFANISDISGIDTTMLIYRIDIEGAPSDTLGGIEVAAGVYGFVIPAQPAGTQMTYRIEAVDASDAGNTNATDDFVYIAGRHLFYDNAVTDFVNTIGPDAASELTGAAVRFTLFNEDVTYALIRNYTDNNRPNSTMTFHIWSADENGLPGDDVITPFAVTPEANLIISSPMTRIDLSDFSDELSGLTGDYFMGYTVEAGEVWLTQTTPAIGNRTYSLGANGWAVEDDDYHFRLVTTRNIVTTNDSCAVATDISGLLGETIDVEQVSGVHDNTTATTTGNPDMGFECFDTPPENTQWFTFVGDGGSYEIRTTDCGAANPMPFNDSQLALFSGDDCGVLTPVACNEDEAFDPDPDIGIYNGLITVETEVDVTYYLLVDGWNGTIGEYCVSMTAINTITCDDLAVASATANADAICAGDTLRVTVDGETVFPLGNDGESGFRWLVGTQDATGADNPFAVPGLLGAFGLADAAYNLTPVNDADISGIGPGIWFFTPVTYSNGVSSDGSGQFATFVFDDGCIIGGPSIQVSFLPEYDDISAEATSEPEQEDVELGSATVLATGGFQNEFTYLWSNGETTATINDLMAGEYSVTVSDPNGCVDPVVAMVSVGFISNVNDAELNAAVQLFPNPARNLATFRYDFTTPVDLNIQLTNTLGQTLINRQLGNATQGSEALDISKLAPGTYFVRYSDGSRQAVKPLVIVR